MHRDDKDRLKWQFGVLTKLRSGIIGSVIVLAAVLLTGFVIKAVRKKKES